MSSEPPSPIAPKSLLKWFDRLGNPELAVERIRDYAIDFEWDARTPLTIAPRDVELTLKPLIHMRLEAGLNKTIHKTLCTRSAVAACMPTHRNAPSLVKQIINRRNGLQCAITAL